MTSFILALGNRPQGSNKFYMTMVYFWIGIMIYLSFAAIFITVKSIQAETADGDFSFTSIFSNYQFLSMIVSLMSTYVLWIVASLLFFDPWHMITCVRTFPFNTVPPMLITIPVPPIHPPNPNLHQRPKHLRLLQHPRHNLGHKGRRQSRKASLRHHKTVRKSRRLHPPRRRRPERPI